MKDLCDIGTLGSKMWRVRVADTTSATVERLVAWFRRFDALLLPTVAIPAPPLDEIEEHAPIPAWLTRPANYLGLCAIALPAGLHQGLPVSVQLVARAFDERVLLEVGKAYLGETRHHKLRPGLGRRHAG